MRIIKQATYKEFDEKHLRIQLETLVKEYLELAVKYDEISVGIADDVQEEFLISGMTPKQIMSLKG